jgi:hypothetical protein
VAFVTPPACEISSPTPKLLAPGASADWTCDIRVDTADAMRALDACDGAADNVFHNTASVVGVIVTGGTTICIPPNTQVAGTDDCSAEILVPPPCDLDVEKQVVCLTNCPGGTPVGSPMNLVEALPGGEARFVITVTNTSPLVKIPRLCLNDLLTCNAWRCGGPVSAVLAGTDVSADFAGLTTVGARQCFTFAGRPAAPWIAPGETLTITFDVSVPPDFNVFGQNPDCRNTVTGEGYTEVCPPNPPALPSDDPCRDSDQADIDVKVPRLRCGKTVSVDVGDDGTQEFVDVTAAVLTSAQFPIRLTYKFNATNSGEIGLSNVCVVDSQLIADAQAAGITVGPCSLNQNATCAGPGQAGVNVGPLAPGAASNPAAASCQLLITDEAHWIAFSGQDSGGADDCHENVASAVATVNVGALCGASSFNATINSETSCGSIVCLSTSNPCPITKAKFEIWNMNEVRFSGTERCMISWDQRYLSVYTPFGIANHFLRQALQTDKGKARIDGVRSPVVCGEESIAAPLLGVAAELLFFGNGVDWAATNLVGAGAEAGRIIYSLPTGQTEDQTVSGASTHLSVISPNSEEAAPGGEHVSPKTWADWMNADEPPAEFAVSSPLVGGTTHKGSLLVYTKVELKWNAQGAFIQDTVVTLTNDGDGDVRVQLYFVNGDQPTPPIFQNGQLVERPHPGCNDVDNVITLTGDESTYWSALTGAPKGVSPFTILDPGVPPGRPDEDPYNVGGRVVRGYVLAWAVDIDSAEIRWNHLSGGAVVVNYQHGAAWAYDAWAFQTVATVNEGEVLLTPLGQLDLNGIEYEFAPGNLLFDFFAAGGLISSGPGNAVAVDTDLTLWAAIKDLRN